MKKRVAGWLYQGRHLGRAACLHALNEPEARAIRALGFQNPIAIVPNAVEVPSFQQEPSIPPWRGTLPPGAKVMLYLGRLHVKKGLRELLLAWGSVLEAARQHGWYLVIAGWGEQESKLHQLADELRLAPHVCFAGPQFGDSKDATFRCANAFILPSKSEGLPMAVLEAWSYGLPVLMTDYCNIPEGFRQNAALRIPTDSEGIAVGLREFIELESSTWTRMGMAGQALVAKGFTWQAVAQQMSQVYKWLIGGGDAPAAVLP